MMKTIAIQRKNRLRPINQTPDNFEGDRDESEEERRLRLWRERRFDEI